MTLKHTICLAFPAAKHDTAIHPKKRYEMKSQLLFCRAKPVITYFVSIYMSMQHLSSQTSNARSGQTHREQDIANLHFTP